MNIFGDNALAMLDMGYSPVPLKPDRNPLLKRWNDLREKALPRADIEALASKYEWLGIGVAGGYNGLVPIDFDTDDAAIMAAVAKVLPRPTVAKKGTKGLTCFYRSDDPIKGQKFMPPPGPEQKPLIEILTTGATTIPPTIHPKISKPYRWLTPRTLFNTRISDLVALTPVHIDQLRAVLQPWCPKRDYAPIRTVDREQVNDRRMKLFAEARVRNEASRLSGTLSGRNIALFRAACSLGKFVHNGIMDERFVRESLMAASRLNAYVMKASEHQAQCTISSGLQTARADRLPDLDAMNGRQPRYSNYRQG